MNTDISLLKEKLNLPDASQIAIVVQDIEKTKVFYQNYFNFNKFIDLEFPFTEVYYHGKLVKSKWKMSFYSLGSVEFEIIQPIYGPSVFNDFLLEHGGGLHHIGFDIDNIKQRLEAYKESGISVIQSQKCENAHSVYLDTAKDGGMIIELVQREGRRAK